MLIDQDKLSPHDFELEPIIQRGGYVYKVDPITERADKWSAKHMPDTALSYFGYYVLNAVQVDVMIGQVLSEGMTIGGVEVTR